MRKVQQDVVEAGARDHTAPLRICHSRAHAARSRVAIGTLAIARRRPIQKGRSDEEHDLLCLVDPNPNSSAIMPPPEVAPKVPAARPSTDDAPRAGGDFRENPTMMARPNPSHTAHCVAMLAAGTSSATRSGETRAAQASTTGDHIRVSAAERDEPQHQCDKCSPPAPRR